MSKFKIGRVQYAIVACVVGLVGGEAARAQVPAAFAKLDVNEDGVLSGVEAGTVKQLDRNGDGVITREEFAGVESSEGPTMSAAEAERRFAQLDITEDEFLSGKEKAGYEKFDSNGDGLVTKAEFLAGMKARSAVPPATPPASVTPPSSIAPAPTGGGDLKSIVDAAWAEVDAKLFDEMDANEDHRLSGTEIKPDHKAFDADGDGRITKPEFLAGMKAKAAKTSLDNFNVPALPPMLGPVPSATAEKNDLTPLVAALESGSISELLDGLNDRGRDRVDWLLLQFVIDLYRREYGKITPPSAGDVQIKEAELKGEKLRETAASVKFARGEATLRVGTSNGVLEGIMISGPLTDEVPERLTGALAGDPGFAREFSKTYGPTAERMVRLMLDGKDQEAFAMFYPEVRTQLGFEKVEAYFQRNREAMGKVEKVEWSGLIVENDEQGKPKPNFKIECNLTTEAGPVTAVVTFQPIGFRGEVVSFQLKKADE